MAKKATKSSKKTLHKATKVNPAAGCGRRKETKKR
jgi:hypothetical protein